MDAAEYKHVVLGLVFLKYISDSFEALHAKLEADEFADPEDEDEYRAENVFWVPAEARWNHLQKNARQPTIGTLVDEAMDAIEKANEGLIRAPERKNVVEIRSFSQRLEDAIKRYHNNALTTAQVIEQLIELAKEIQETRQRGDDEGLSVEERAFYAALADNESAVDVMGNEQLRIIAAELLNHLKRNISVDWTERQAARAKLRVLVKRILRRYGYPPDLQDDAVRTVIQQAEMYAAEWAKAA